MSMHSVYSLQLSFFSSVVLQTSITLSTSIHHNHYIILYSLQYGQTPVYLASWRGHVPVVKLLMKIGADIKICKEVYDFPLYYGLSIVDVSVDSIALISNAAYSRTTDWVLLVDFCC